MPKKTENLELVETGNLARALQRLASSAGGYDSGRWRRALLHAVQMSHVTTEDGNRKIREALCIP